MIFDEQFFLLDFASLYLSISRRSWEGCHYTVDIKVKMSFAILKNFKIYIGESCTCGEERVESILEVLMLNNFKNYIDK